MSFVLATAAVCSLTAIVTCMVSGCFAKVVAPEPKAGGRGPAGGGGRGPAGVAAPVMVPAPRRRA